MISGNILVIGATGKQGGALISALLAIKPTQFEIFALTRDSSSVSALQLASKGIIVIQGDTTKPDAIFAQIRDLYGVFLVTTPNSNEREQAIPFIDVAIASGVQHVIFTSVDQGRFAETKNHPAPPAHFGTKLAIEKHLINTASNSDKEVKWTVLRPTSFMDNLSPDFIGKAVATMLKQMGSTRISLISTADIGRVAALAFEKPDCYAGRALVLTGDLKTFEEINAIFAGETGKDLPLTFETLVNGMQWAIHDLGVSMKYFRDGAYDYEMDTDLSRELGLKDFRTWLKEASTFENK